jgi:hypothetical protein
VNSQGQANSSSPAPAASGSGANSATTIAWQSADGSEGQILLGQDGRPTFAFAPAPTGQDGVQQAPGRPDEFRLTVSVAGNGGAGEARDRYLDLMKRCLTRLVFKESGPPIDPGATAFDPVARTEGRDWPADAETMAGMLRLDNVQHCVVDVLRHGVPGDLIETGVWRGGTTIFMRAILAAYGDASRQVWVADSFQGLPKPDTAKYPADAGWDLSHFTQLAVSLEQVQANFARYDLLDDRVRFLKGWFKDTLPSAPMARLAVMRLDGDLYESTMDGLTALYPKLSPGGYAIIDDYGAIPACRQAVHDYRDAHGIVEPIQQVDWTGAFWQRAR